MGWKAEIFGGVAIGAILSAALWLDHIPPPRLDLPTVKIMKSNGHGSATNIGNGYFITAAHVVGDDVNVDIKTSSGATSQADVIWSSTKYDVALMRSDIDGVGVADLECRTPTRGESIRLSGNPINLEYIDTYGVVAGDAMFNVGPWSESIPINAAIAPGMSGGGAFDSDGDLIGVNVGVMMMQVGLGGGPVGIGYVVPSSVVCMLMGRV